MSPYRPQPASPLFTDSAHPVPEGRRVPIGVEQADRDVLVAVHLTLEEILAVQRRILAALGASSDSRSSVELKVSSARTVPDPTVKIYEGSPVTGLVHIALETFGELKREVEAHALDGWRQTVNDLAEQKAG